jgi:hypothetical protein
MFQKIIAGLVEQPLLTSLFVTDLGILLFHRPPFFFSLIMFSALLGMTMYFGQKWSLFNV